MRKEIFGLVLVLGLLHSANCVLGIDLAGSYSTSTFQCLKNAGNSFAIVRAFHSYGSIDTTATASLNNARSSGLTTDIYMFPCRGKSATAQVDEMMSGISANLYGMIWIDVETNPSSGCSWSGHDSSSNCQFLTDVVNRVKSKGKEVGIYSSASMWTNIFGSKTACPSFSSIKLWYAHYDGSASFSDFSSFGGWTKPYMKQFAGDTKVCSVDLDKNYHA